MRAGARSRLAAASHAVVLMAVVAAGAGLASRIPLSALAGVLIATTLRMVDLREVRGLLRVGRSTAATFFATIGPADLLLVYAALTQKNTQAERRSMALRGVLIATAILMFFAIFGDVMLKLFGITLPALRIAGGVLLLLISIEMVFARHSGATGTTPEEEARLHRMVRGLMERGVLMSITGLGCLSTPMGDAELESLVETFATVLAAERAER